MPTPEQLAAMAKEYSTVRPIEVPKCEPHDWAELCRHLSRLNALVLPLKRLQNAAASDIAEQALSAVNRMQAQVSALDGGECDFACEPPMARNFADLLRQALLSNAKVCDELYRPREGRSLAEQLPYLTSLSHYTYSLLLTLAAI